MINEDIEITDTCFKHLINGTSSEVKMWCPFLAIFLDQVKCQIEHSSFKVHFLEIDFANQKTGEGKPLNCKCLDINNRGFVNCETFKKAYIQYKKNPKEFAILMQSLAGKIHHECDERDKRQVGKR
jgi:hypothetical protein